MKLINQKNKTKGNHASLVLNRPKKTKRKSIKKEKRSKKKEEINAPICFLKNQKKKKKKQREEDGLDWSVIEAHINSIAWLFFC